MNRYKPVGNWYPNNSEIFVFGPDCRYAQYVNIDVSDVRERSTGRSGTTGRTESR